MKKLLVIFLLICLWAAMALGQNFYDVNSVHTIQLVFSQPNWDGILDSLYAVGNEERLACTVTIDGVQYDSVGVRYKGFSTYNPDRVKNPLNIKLDYIFSGQNIQGYGTLKLANVWFDPSFVREVLGYDIARKYMPASLANYANVYINGTLMGIYVSVEDVDKLFMNKHFLSNDNARFKGEITGPPQGYVIWGYKGQDSASYTDMYQLESKAGWADLIDFLDTLNNFPAAIEKVLNVDRHLWMMAYDNLLVNLDAPINFAHNFYLYRDDSYRFNPIIWDLNMNFGGLRLLVSGSLITIAQMQHLDPYLHATHPDYPIVNRFLSNPTYRKRYIAHMKTIMSENFSNNWYQNRAQALRSIIDQYVQADTNKYSSYAEYLSNLNLAVGLIPGIVQLMAARVTYLNSLPDFRNESPHIGAISHTPTAAPANSALWISADVDFATSVQLAYRDNPVEPFVYVTMYDDGAHHDGGIADNVFGASVQAGNADIHYFIYSENDNAASFAPARAEFEDSVVTVVVPPLPPVKINEFLADNATTHADQNGEYDDWIELHNLSADAISLRGFHLSDKAGNIGKWTFPDTSIAPFGYLIVWADENGSQVGLHANFKLSASGESVILSDSVLVVIDSISFGPQTTDISMGRCPDGTGAFGKMTPSFAARNTCPAACGDADGSGDFNIADAVFLVNYIFAGGAAPYPIGAGDADCDDEITIADAVYLVNYIFNGGAAPCAGCK